MVIGLDSSSYNPISIDYNRLEVLSKLSETLTGRDSRSAGAASIKHKMCFF